MHEKNYCAGGARKTYAMRGRPEASVRHGLVHAAPAAPRVRLMRAMGLHGHRPRQVTTHHAQRS
ncbi:hypothetical protein DRB06_11620 [Actinomyces sp. Z5]|uniref:hypothetical protein n=1 Tax=Actinomyces sp. Z16 TaxID=2079536 RepID=UPI000D59A3E2|nr:hypothetical protein [Actinomyces sp. Z16]RAX19735.1 hypothetical protein DRB06_11620 [Actinomyces sp. Z5]RAX22751.1 hypothetical protein DRB07_07245 [Actinomyces sp. Z3]